MISPLSFLGTLILSQQCVFAHGWEPFFAISPADIFYVPQRWNPRGTSQHLAQFVFSKLEQREHAGEVRFTHPEHNKVLVSKT